MTTDSRKQEIIQAVGELRVGRGVEIKEDVIARLGRVISGLKLISEGIYFSNIKTEFPYASDEVADFMLNTEIELQTVKLLIEKGMHDYEEVEDLIDEAGVQQYFKQLSIMHRVRLWRARLKGLWIRRWELGGYSGFRVYAGLGVVGGLASVTVVAIAAFYLLRGGVA